MLFFWDFLFLPLPFVFQNRYQQLPADFGSRGFFAARAPYIQYHCSRLRAMTDDEIEAFLDTSFQCHQSVGSFIDWSSVEIDWLRRVARGLGGYRVAEIGVRLRTVMAEVTRVVKAWDACAKGLPDLLLVRAGPAREMPSVLLAEVKGARDRLSDAQSWWLGEFEACGVNVEVLRVSAERNTGDTQLVGARWLRKVAAGRVEREGVESVKEEVVKPVKEGVKEERAMKEEKEGIEETVKEEKETMKPVKEEVKEAVKETKQPYNTTKQPINTTNQPINTTTQSITQSINTTTKQPTLQPAPLPPAQPIFHPQDEIIDICSSSSSSGDVVAVSTPTFEPVRIKREEPVVATPPSSQETPRRAGRKRQTRTPSCDIKVFFSKRFHFRVCEETNQLK